VKSSRRITLQKTKKTERRSEGERQGQNHTFGGKKDKTVHISPSVVDKTDERIT